MSSSPYQQPTKIIIVNARNTDRYALVYEYADGSQSGETGSYQTYDSALEAAERTDGAEIEDGTSEEA
jgi:hypothetical protein